MRLRVSIALCARGDETNPENELIGTMRLRMRFALVNHDSVLIGIVQDGHPTDGAFEGFDHELYAAGANLIYVGVEIIDFERGGDAE